MTFNTFPFRRSVLAWAVALVCTSGPASAAIINVSNGCTLINAIKNANADADTDGPKGCLAGHGADTINLARNKTYILKEQDNGSFDGRNGLPSVSSVITINGNGSIVSRSDTADTPGFRLFHVAASGKLELKSMTIKNGNCNVNGGGIANWGTLTLTNTSVSNNTAGFQGSGGGGIFNSGELTLKDSTVSGNVALAFSVRYSSGPSGGMGGGIYNTETGRAAITNSTISRNKSYSLAIKDDTFAGGGINNKGTMSLTNSTLSGNSAPYGGGISNSGTMSLTNSTLSGNGAGSAGGISNSGTISLTNSTLSGNGAYHAGGIGNGGTISLMNCTLSGNKTYTFGGGINNGGMISLTNSTLSGNSANYGGGINNGGILILSNSTLSDNSAHYDGGGIRNDDHGILNLRNTIIANSKGGDCIGPLKLTDVNLIEDGSCGATLSGDPKLGPLLDNGGLTRTHALLATSPAIDAGLCSSESDQRGINRPKPSGGACDIGAYERIPTKLNTISPSVWEVVNFFNAQIASGGILGTFKQPWADQRRSAALNQLIVAGSYRGRGFGHQACNQLARLSQRIDSDHHADFNDYVTGSEAATLAAKITELRNTWACS